MPFAETPRLKYHYRKAGEGSNALVFLHGNYASSRWWEPQLEQLPEGFRAYAPDIRGCGPAAYGTRLKTRHRNSLSIVDLANDLAEFIEVMHLSQPVLVGHSLGAVIATEYALTYPDKIVGLVLEDTGPHGGIPNEILSRPFFMVLEIGKKLMMRRALRFAGLPKGGALAQAIVKDALASSPGQYMAFTPALSRWNATKRLSQLQSPTLLVWGADDRIMPVRIGRSYKRQLPNAELIEIPKTGHSPHLERPDEFAGIVGEFVRQLNLDSENPNPGKWNSWREKIRKKIQTWIPGSMRG